MQKREYFGKKTGYNLATRYGGEGGLVFQDRYRFDRLALMKNFPQWRK
jgi:hypothetical protein